MKFNITITFLCLTLFFLGFSKSIVAGELDIPNQFTAGAKAVAAEVNSNFNAVELAVDGNAADIAALLQSFELLNNKVTLLESNNLALQASVASLEQDNAQMQNFITDILPHINGTSDEQGHPTVIFSGVNVHINNDLGATERINGTGNLVVGYNQNMNSSRFYCTAINSSLSAYTTQNDCELNGGIWSNTAQKLGSHNVLIGTGHNYTQYGGLVSGFNNISAGAFASVSGGERNLANGAYSSISGGFVNVTNGEYASVSGGQANVGSGNQSSITGGIGNSATGEYSVIAGGQNNTSSGFVSSIGGGDNNLASGTESSISGGRSNIASGEHSSISGGSTNRARGPESSVSGGLNRIVEGESDWRAGSLLENN